VHCTYTPLHFLVASKKSSVCRHPQRRNAKPVRQPKFHASFAIANDILRSAVEPLRGPVLHHCSLNHRVEQRVLSRSLQSVLIRVLEANTPLLPRPRTRHRRKDMQILRLRVPRLTRHPEQHPRNMPVIKPTQSIQGLIQLTGNTSTRLRFRHSLI
jgi:hypothetical protein